LGLPTVGTAGLAEVARMMGARSDQLTMLAERAVASGDRAAAQQIVQAVLRAEPGNVQARTVQSALEEPFGEGPLDSEGGQDAAWRGAGYACTQCADAN
jgi:alkyl sulfatase BDS1-like metallo-beta-lactamase superfamily hydrolase